MEFLCLPAGAVVSSKGERGKPSRGTSERREWRELETLWSLSSFKWKQLHRPPFPISIQLPPHLFTPLTLFPLSLYLPRSLSFSFSVLPPATDELKECCSPIDFTTDSDSFYRRKINVPALQRGAWEKVKKAVNETRILWREYEKRYCLKQLLYSRYHKERVSAVDQGEPSSVVQVKEICSLGNCFFSFLFFGVCFGIKVKRKRWTMLMFNLRDTGSISSIKQNLEDFYVFFFSFFL